jgi:hypothetical protein
MKVHSYTTERGLFCWVPELLESAGWNLAMRWIRMWAWLHNVDVDRVRFMHGSMAFHAHRRFLPPCTRYRSACGCGWTLASSTISELLVGVDAHPHFTSSCAHLGAVKATHWGEVMCLDCQTMVGFDASVTLDRRP